jgi:hypothetical protein
LGDEAAAVAVGFAKVGIAKVGLAFGEPTATGNDAALVVAVDEPPSPGVNDPAVTDEPDDAVPGT